METVNVVVGRTENNFSAYVEELDGFVCTADNFEELKNEVADGITFHLEGMKEDNEPLPEIFQGDYSLTYKWDVESLMHYYKGIFTKSALEKLTGINQRQLGHYANGVSKPRKQQVEKIENALHSLGEELLSIQL